jgi:trehalose 6-phosphate phosphatase
LLERCAGERADARGQADEGRVAPFDVAVERVADRAGERGQPDRAKRRGHGGTFGEVRDEEEQRNGDESATDSEERAEEPGDDADDGEPKHRSYRMGMDALARLREAPERAAILLDVDGTLAPIVARPEDAAVPEGTRAVLRDLVGRYALVAAVTGRPGTVGREMVGVEGVDVVGSHGLELAVGVDEWRARLQEFRRRVDWPVEDKGLGLSYHYRTHDDPVRARAELERVAERARGAGLRARFGRMVLELLPPLDAHKGTAVQALLEGPGLTRALFAGDDTTDLDAFGAIDELEVGVKVAVGSDESPPELVARADVVVSGPAGLVELLRTL